MRLKDSAEDSARRNRMIEAKLMIVSYCCDAGAARACELSSLANLYLVPG